MKRQKDNKTTRKFNIVMSGQFRTLAMFYIPYHMREVDERRAKRDEQTSLSYQVVNIGEDRGSGRMPAGRLRVGLA